MVALQRESLRVSIDKDFFDPLTAGHPLGNLFEKQGSLAALTKARAERMLDKLLGKEQDKA